MKRSTYQKIYDALVTSQQKYMTSEMLAQVIGLYPDVINEALSLFNPVVTLDITFNLKELLPQLEDYLKASKPMITKRNRAPKINEKTYDTFSAFVYEKMTISGIVDKNIILTDKELRLAKRIISAELKGRKK
jgi:hypothetical protein